LLPAAMMLAKGDKIRIGSKDAIVDAVIALGGEQPVRLARIGSGPERWVVTNARFAADVKRIPFDIHGTTADLGTSNLQSHGTGSALVEQCDLTIDDTGKLATWQVYGGETVNGPIAFVLTLPSETLSLAGNGLLLDQIEISASNNPSTDSQSRA
jgi:hypothetical protein